MRYRYWIFAVLLACGSAFAQTAAKSESRDMELVGFDDRQGRSAYQPLVHRRGDRWIAPIGHHGRHARKPLSGAEEPDGTALPAVPDPTSAPYPPHDPGVPGQ